ncbi:CU044_5270 family protein [Actinomadura hibisca]|uniref:CU044_5270 family protein n=1 Tax=Actinomadura hibisca TaxID=68565 RepID=UPI00082DD130|nr:CU044_5270 family protein [Actinomadura hibisca]
MDELDALRQVRTTLAQEEHPDHIALRTGWRPGDDAAPRRAPGRAPNRRRFALAGVAAATAVAAGAVAVVALPSDGRAPAPSRSDAGADLRILDRGDVLLVAADNAQKATAQGKYWLTQRVTGNVFAIGKRRADHYKVESRMRYRTWVGVDGYNATAHDELPGRPVTARDEARWRAAGSPTALNNVPDGLGRIVLFMPGSTFGRTPPWGGRDRDWTFHGLSLKQVGALPTDPKALENVLLGLKGDWRAAAPSDGRDAPIRALRTAERVRALSEAAGELLSYAPAPPKVRAAAFRMMAGLPGIKVEGRGADPLGRPGSVITLPVTSTVPLGFTTANQQLGTYRRQWIVDPSRGLLLAIRNVVAVPPHGSRKMPRGDDGRPRRVTVADTPDRFHKPGEVASYEVFEKTEWTNAKPY